MYEEGHVKGSTTILPIITHRKIPTGIEETVGLALSGVSLLAGFAGTVDGYNLIRDIFATDNSLRSLAADWHVEIVRFKRWGEHFRIDAGSKSLLHTKSALIRGAISNVIADILALQQQTQPIRHQRPPGASSERAKRRDFPGERQVGRDPTKAQKKHHSSPRYTLGHARQGLPTGHYIHAKTEEQSALKSHPYQQDEQHPPIHGHTREHQGPPEQQP